MSRMRANILALVAVAGLALAACGGSGEKTMPTATRQDFIAKTDALCKASNVRTRALNRELVRAAAGAGDDDELLRRLAPILDKGYAPVRDNAAVFKAADPPPADKARIERIRAAYDRQAQLVRKLAQAAQSGNAELFKSLSEEQRVLVTDARTLARDYGFKECGSSKSDVT